MGDGPLFEIRGRSESRKCAAKLFVGSIEFHKAKFVGTYLADTIRYEHVASISARRGMLASTVLIETSGGRRFALDFVPKSDADRFISVANQQIAAVAASSRSPRPLSVADQTAAPTSSTSWSAPPPLASEPPPLPPTSGLAPRANGKRSRGVLATVIRAVVVASIVLVAIVALLVAVTIYEVANLPKSAPLVATVPSTPAPALPASRPSEESTSEPPSPPPPATRVSLPTKPEIAFEEVERVRLPYLIIALRTSAASEADVRSVVDRIRLTALRNEDMFELRIYPTTLAKIMPIRETIDAHPGTTWQAELSAEYSFNRNSGLDEITMHIATPGALPIEGVKATELLRNRMTTIQIAAVVHVDRLTPEVAMKVGHYYESVSKDVEWLHVYLTDSGEKWSEYPNVYPASVPSQIGFVYDRGPNSPGHVVKGTEFR